MYTGRRLVALSGRSGVKCACRCSHQDCEFTLKANDDAALERLVPRHDAREHRQKFDRVRFEGCLEVS
jgi:hypothetical protein